jgi:hypothetical protein
MSRVGPLDPGSVAVAPRRSLTDLLWVANTRHGPGGHWFARATVDSADHDHLATPADAVRYLVDHGVAVPGEMPTPGDLAALASIRAMVRGLLEPAAGWTDAARGLLGAQRWRLDDDRRLSADGDGWSALVGDLLPPLLELVRLRDRLVMCGNPLCRLVFLDESRSGTRRWCDDAGCGNRDRVRRHRDRASVAAG